MSKKPESPMERLKKITLWQWGGIVIFAGILSNLLLGLQASTGRSATARARAFGRAAATLGVENGWYVGEKKVMQEHVRLCIYPALTSGRTIDVELTWTPVDEPVTLWGAAGKSYGGLTLRFAPRKKTVITTAAGRQAEDLKLTRLEWADLTARFAGASGQSGGAIFVDPAHPDYPPTWLTRHGSPV